MNFFDKLQKFLYKQEDTLKDNINNFTGKKKFTKFNRNSVSLNYNTDKKEENKESNNGQDNKYSQDFTNDMSSNSNSNPYPALNEIDTNK